MNKHLNLTFCVICVVVWCSGVVVADQAEKSLPGLILHISVDERQPLIVGEPILLRAQLINASNEAKRFKISGAHGKRLVDADWHVLMAWQGEEQFRDIRVRPRTPHSRAYNRVLMPWERMEMSCLIWGEWPERRRDQWTEIVAKPGVIQLQMRVRILSQVLSGEAEKGELLHAPSSFLESNVVQVQFVDDEAGDFELLRQILQVHGPALWTGEGDVETGMRQLVSNMQNMSQRVRPWAQWLCVRAARADRSEQFGMSITRLGDEFKAWAVELGDMAVAIQERFSPGSVPFEDARAFLIVPSSYSSDPRVTLAMVQEPFHTDVPHLHNITRYRENPGLIFDENYEKYRRWWWCGDEQILHELYSTQTRTPVEERMRKISLAITMYAIDHRDHYPDSIEQIRPYLGDEESQREILTHPDTGMYPGFVYIKPADTVSELRNLGTIPTTIMLYEACSENGFNRNGVIGYVDGRVQKQ